MERPEYSTQGDPANATGKRRPEKIRFRTDFVSRQELIWEIFVQSQFMDKRLFEPANAVAAVGRTIYKPLSSEPDLNIFEYITVEKHVCSIINAIFRDQK